MIIYIGSVKNAKEATWLGADPHIGVERNRITSTSVRFRNCIITINYSQI